MPNIIQKRQFNRLNVVQSAMLVSRIFGAIKGEIRDFSANGVLFALSNSPMAVNLPDQPVAVSFKSVSGQYRITGRIVRVFERSIGIAIDDFPDPAYHALVSLAQQPFNPAPAQPDTYGKIKTMGVDTGCMTLYREFIDRVIGHFYGNLEIKLAALELKETSTSQRWALRQAAPMLIARRKEIEEALLADPVAGQKTPYREKEVKPALELVDTKEFDDWLAVSQLIHKLNTDYAAEIAQFESRYDKLFSATRESGLRPFNPQRIFWALHESLGKFITDNELKAQLYKLFFESVSEYFASFYVDLNQAVAFVALPQADLVKRRSSPDAKPVSEPLSALPLAEPVSSAPAAAENNRVLIFPANNRSLSISDYLAGATPVSGTARSSSDSTGFPLDSISLDYGLNQLLWRFNYFLKNPEAAANSRALSDVVVGWSDPKATDNDAAAMPAVYELPGRAVSRIRFIAPSVPHISSDPVYPVAPEQLAPILSAVDRIRQNRSGRDFDSHAIPIKTQLRDTLAQLKAAQGILDPFVETIGGFEEGLNSRAMGKSQDSAIIVLLKKMELPLIKLALTDKHFVQGKSHPVLQTVNLIERFHAATDDAGVFFDQRLHRLLDLLITRIVDQFESNKAVFEEINNVLVSLLRPIEDARKNKIGQIQLAFSQREKNHPDDHAVKIDPGQPADDAIIALMEVLTPGDWVSVAIAEAHVAFQLVCHNATSGRYLFVNRSATTVLEYAWQELYDVLSRNGMNSLPEYDLPFMERSAYKGLLNVYEQVCQQATHDPVSGLINRKALMAHLETIFGQELAQRKGIFVCMMILDRNNLLCQNIDSSEAESSFAAFIGEVARYIRPEDVFARLSETIFTIVLHDSNTQRAIAGMKTLITQIERQRIRFQDKYFAIGANIGISELTDFIDTPQKLLKTAGAACISAKKQGINWVELYTPHNKQIEREQSMFEWAGAIDQMLADKLLYLRCQKIQPMNSRGNLLPHYEILLGLPDGFDITIQGFVLAAEKWNRSADIDMWVLQRSFVWLRGQESKLSAIGGVSINLSGQSLNNQRIWAIIKENLQAEPELAKKIIFEITETAVIQNLETAQRFIETTRSYGCRFSLDDFGSGYNSFAYLRTLSLDFLKIDGAFVRDMVTSPTDFAMVKCMHDIAHALGLKTVAEYVENDDILDRLLELGVDYAQGYAVETSKPITELIL
ncbi:MAG: DUF1631 family protein [Burkholderiales bacterium]